MPSNPGNSPDFALNTDISALRLALHCACNLPIGLVWALAAFITQTARSSPVDHVPPPSPQATDTLSATARYASFILASLRNLINLQFTSATRHVYQTRLYLTILYIG